jgi:hypothetical protein
MHTVFRLENPKGRPRHIWEDNIIIDLWGIGCEGVDCCSSGSGFETVAGPFEHDNEFRVQQKARYFLTV